MSTVVPRTASEASTPRGAAVTMALLVVLLWALELVDTVTGNALDALGITPRVVSELPQIYTAPLLHFGWGHLAGNTVPFFVLGYLVLREGVRRLAATALAIVTSSGLVTWLASAPGTVTAGASGLVFGWLTYLLARGVWSRDTRQILVAVVVFLLYGGVLWGVLPLQAGVSWQGHLGGAVGGVLIARWLHGRTPTGGRRTR